MCGVYRLRAYAPWGKVGHRPMPAHATTIGGLVAGDLGASLYGGWPMDIESMMAEESDRGSSRNIGHLAQAFRGGWIDYRRISDEQRAMLSGWLFQLMAKWKDDAKKERYFMKAFELTVMLEKLSLDTASAVDRADRLDREQPTDRMDLGQSLPPTMDDVQRAIDLLRAPRDGQIEST